MGLLDKMRTEKIEIIEWLDDSRTTLAWRFPRHDNEIKNGAELIVREGQQAVFVYRGQLADQFTPGHYTLTTENLPVLSSLAGWRHGFDSPFRSEVYFINTRPVTELRWGTPQPVTLRDAEFGMVPVRANGLCVVTIADPAIFLREVIGTDSAVELDELTELLRRLIAQAFADLLGDAGVGALDLQTHNAELAAKLRGIVAERVDDEYGLAVNQIAMNVSLPEEITAAITAGVARGLETRGYVGNVGDLGRMQQVRAADAVLAAAENEGGAAGSMVGAGIGMALGGRLAGGLTPGDQGGDQATNQTGAQAGRPGPGVPMAGAAGPPPPPPAAQFHVAANGQSSGPYSVSALQSAVGAGQLTSSTLVWTAGMTSWAPAGSVQALTGLFAPPPPPPPPSLPAPPPAAPAGPPPA